MRKKFYSVRVFCLSYVKDKNNMWVKRWKHVVLADCNFTNLKRAHEWVRYIIKCGSHWKCTIRREVKK